MPEPGQHSPQPPETKQQEPITLRPEISQAIGKALSIEFRSPLARIQDVIEIFHTDKYKTDPEVTDYLTGAESELDTVRQLLNDVSTKETVIKPYSGAWVFEDFLDKPTLEIIPVPGQPLQLTPSETQAFAAAMSHVITNTLNSTVVLKEFTTNSSFDVIGTANMAWRNARIIIDRINQLQRAETIQVEEGKITPSPPTQSPPAS